MENSQRDANDEDRPGRTDTASNHRIDASKQPGSDLAAWPYAHHMPVPGPYHPRPYVPAGHPYGGPPGYPPYGMPGVQLLRASALLISYAAC